MALTELQQPTKSECFSNLQSIATSMQRLMDEWRNAADFIEDVDSTDLDSMGVASGQVRTDLANFRIVINEMHDFFTGNATTQTNVPKTVVDKIRRMK